MRYETLFEAISREYRENEVRHRANGDRHLAEGRPDYAAGSYRKADKWKTRLNRHEFFTPSDALLLQIIGKICALPLDDMEVQSYALDLIRPSCESPAREIGQTARYPVREKD